MIRNRRLFTLSAASLIIAACAQDDQITRETEPFSAIGEKEALKLVGTEPFWKIEVSGANASFKSPEDIDGTPFTVDRFAGNNGLGYSGELRGEPIQIAVTPGDCSDGMSDSSYPYTATISWGDRTLYGCGYTDAQPATGGE